MLLIENKELLDILQILEENCTTRKSPGIPSLDSALPYVAEPQIVLLLVEAVHFYICSPTKFLHFQSTSFCMALLKLLYFYEMHILTEYLPLVTFQNVKLPDLTGASGTARQVFLKSMPFFSTVLPTRRSVGQEVPRKDKIF